MVRRNGTVVCLRVMYDHIHLGVNGFLDDRDYEFGYDARAMDLNKAIEQLIEALKRNGGGVDRVPEQVLCAYHQSYSLFYTSIILRYNEHNQTMVPFLKKIVSSCTAVYQVLEDRHRMDERSRVMRDSALKPVNYLARTLGSRLEKQTEKEKHTLDTRQRTMDMLAKLKEKHGWALMATDDGDLLASQALMDRRFVFTAEYESLEMDMQTQQAHSIISVLEAEMGAGIDVTKTLWVFCIFLEEAIRRLSNNKSEVPNFTLGDVRRNEWNAGRTQWSAVVRFLDAAVADLRLLDWESGRRWQEEERLRVVAKRPDPARAFVFGLHCVWNVWRAVRIAGLKSMFSTTVKLSNFELHKLLSGAFQRKLILWSAECTRTKELVKEVVEAFPSFKQRLAKRVKGAKYAFHGLMVAHVVFRRSKRLVSTECPETMMLWGKELVQLQEKVRLFSEAAVIVSACTDEELGAVSKYIRGFTQKELVPIFMPISQGSTDRAEYALKNKRGAYEKEFTKLFALHALRIGSRTLPGNLSMLQEWANSIALDLGKVIKMDRGVHFALYAELINDMCKEFGDGK